MATDVKGRTGIVQLLHSLGQLLAAGVDVEIKPLRREVRIDGQPYTLTIDPEGLKLVPKGKRKGLELRWTELTSGDAALATALQASLQD